MQPWLALILLFTLLGCAPHTLYRSDHTLCVSASPEHDCAKQMLAEYRDPRAPDAGYLLGFIEFDDQGELHDRAQLRAVVEKLNTSAAGQDLLVVVFVHGWKHSAAPGDGNVATFHDNLARLSRLESSLSRQTGEPARRVFGIYLGWRGESVTLPVLKELSFWDRKSTAHKVGYGGITEALAQIELVKKTRNAVAPDSRTRLVVIGHSFGGAVVYSALSQILMSRFVDTVGPAGQVTDVEGFGDLVVLINPAFEAMQFAPLSDMANERRTYFASQLPVLAILTSEADDATRLAFPLGRWFSTLFDKHREVVRNNAVTGESEVIHQRQANVTAVGHFDPYKTHDLRATGQAPLAAQEKSPIAAEVQRFAQLSRQWDTGAPGNVIEFRGARLKRTQNSAGRNPYLIIRVDEALIHDHNHIDDPRITEFIRQLILLAGQSPDPKKRELTRSRALEP